MVSAGSPNIKVSRSRFGVARAETQELDFRGVALRDEEETQHVLVFGSSPGQDASQLYNTTSIAGLCRRFACT